MSSLDRKDVQDEATFGAWISNAESKERALVDLGRDRGLTLDAALDGSALVGLSEEYVVKVMGPFDRELHDVEVAALKALHGELPAPTPRVVEVFDWEGWPGIVMTRVRGVPLSTVWDRLSTTDQLRLGRQVGEWVQALHDLRAPPAIPRMDWPTWCRDRLATFEATQIAKGLPPPCAKVLTAWLADQDLTPGTTAWLHTEIMPPHLFVDRIDETWMLTGVIDFEPSWVGPADYEFASIGVFVSAGDPKLLHQVLDAAGRSLSPERLLAMACLHRYANLSWYHRRLGGPLHEPRALAEFWFAS